MGQLFSSEEELSQVKDVIGSLLYDAMLEGGAVPNLGVVHPLLLANHDESRTGLQQQLQQLQSRVGNRVPTYLRDLVGRLSSFSDEPRLAGLIGSVVAMVMDIAFTSSKWSRGPAGSSSCQRVWELQELMEEYLKRCRISLSDKNKLIQDALRLEAQLSLGLTQLKTCLLGGDCDSRSLRHWASAAAFHTHMLVHLAALEAQPEPLAARAALEQYKEDLAHIIPAYRRYKSNTVCAVKCRGGLSASCGEIAEEGSMTGITVTDRETGRSVTVPLSAMRTETGTGGGVSAVSSSIDPDQISSDQYAQAYLHHLFSDKGPVAELENHFIKASESLRTLRTRMDQSDGAQGADGEQGADGDEGDDREKTSERGRQDETEGREQRREGLQLSGVETQ